MSDVDCRIRDGTYKWKFGGKPSFPMCPGLDCVGIISSVGSLAIKSGLDVGDRVAALSMNGCTAKYVNLKIDEVIKVPDDVDAAEAVTVIRTYTAAFQCLMHNFRGMNRYARHPKTQKHDIRRLVLWKSTSLYPFHVIAFQNSPRITIQINQFTSGIIASSRNQHIVGIDNRSSCTTSFIHNSD